MTDIPSQELTNLYIDAETVFSKEIKSNERLSACSHYPQMVAVVETFSLNEIRRKSADIHGIDLIITSIFPKPLFTKRHELGERLLFVLKTI